WEVIWFVGVRGWVVGVNDRCFVFGGLGCVFKQGERFPIPRPPPDPAGADYPNMISRGIYLSLAEAAAVKLREVDMPARGWIQIRRCGRTIIDNVNRAVVSRHPREQRRRCRRVADCDRRRPGIALVL